MHDVEEVSEAVDQAPPAPIEMDRNMIRKLLKAGKIVKQPTKPESVGLYDYDRITPGTFVRIDPLTYAVHSESMEEFKTKLTEQGIELRKLSRPEIRKIARTLPNLLNQLEKQNRENTRKERLNGQHRT